MIVRLLQLVVLLLAFVPEAGAASGNELRLARTTADLPPVAPGSVVTSGFRLESDAGRTVVETLALPAGWSVVTPASRLELAPGVPRTRILAFQTPPTTPAGLYHIPYGVSDAGSPDVQSGLTFDVRVTAVAKLTLAVVDKPDFVTAGDTADVTVRVTNGGNAPLHARLEAAPESGLHASLPVATVDLAAQQAADLVLHVGTDKNELRPTQRIVRLAVTAPNARAETVLLVPLTPVPARTDRWRRFPVRASVTATTDGEHIAVQPALQGTGAIDAKGLYTADFLLRGPDAQGTGTFGLHDEYRLAVSGPLGTARIGDQVYSLSPLTSPSRYGRGVGVLATPGAARIGAYVVQERFDADPDAEIGATAGANLWDRGTVGLQFLRRYAETQSTIWSLAATAVPVKDMLVESEAAADTSDPAHPAWAGRVALVGRLPNGLAIAAREVAAAPDYTGYERDIHRTEASATLPLPHGVSTYASFQRAQRNLALDPGRGTAPLDYRAETRISLLPADRWSLSAGLLGGTDDDRLSTAGWREGAVRAQVAASLPRIYGSVQATSGIHQDRATGAASAAAQVGAFVTLTPSARWSLRGFANWGTGGIGGVGGATSTSLFATDSSAGAGAAWEPVDGLVAEVQGRMGLDPAHPKDQVDAHVRYTFTGGTTLETRWRIDAGTSVEHSALLSLSVPVGVPVARNLASGGIRGRVYDADAPGGPGIGGVVLRAGGIIAVTAPDGSFTFGRLTPGTFRVVVDRASLGIDRVGTEEMPLTVEVPAGGFATVELGATRSASLSGRVQRVGISATVASTERIFGQGVDDGETSGVSGVTVVISHGNERLTQLTGADGTFTFAGLRPGVWSLSVPADGIPVFFTAPGADRQVELKPGELAETTIVVVPQARLIRMMDKPLVIDAAPVRASPPPPPPHVRRRSPRAGPTDAALADADHDGWMAGNDCDDQAAAIHPHAIEVCDGRADDDCDGLVDDGCEGWATASWLGQADVAPAGFVDGHLRYVIANDAGASVCEVAADWVDDGGDLPVESCPGCEWAARLAMHAPRVTGPACAGVDPDLLTFGDASFGYATTWSLRGRTVSDVLLRWNGVAWVPVATDVGTDRLRFHLNAPLPE
jgi:hypothetical protein